MSRPLTLHVSALNDAEYSLYTSSIHDILEYTNKHPIDYDKLSVGVREARAWLRGRYPTLASSTLDLIFRLFSPETDLLSGGQFFAVLRLVSHVLAGKQVDSSLIFVQAHPNEHKSRSSSPHSKLSRVPSPVQNPFKMNGSTRSAPAASSAPAKPQPPSLPPKPTNPFLNRRASQGLPPQSAPAGTGTFPHVRPTVTQDVNTPPLPPRKPPVLPPPRHASMSHPQAATREPPPTPSVPHANRHTTNTLIQQSLQATRIAQSLKQAEHRLEQERIMEILRSSSDSVNSLRRVRSNSPNKIASSSASSNGSVSSSAERTAVQNRVPQLPPRRNLSPPASTVISSRSFERVATASLSPSKRAPLHFSSNGPPEPPQWRQVSPTLSPSHTPPRPLTELPPEPPPTHPDRKPTALSIDADRVFPSGASSRVGRSRSLHHPSPPPVPPPPRRKRPESAQITPTSPSPYESPFADMPRTSLSSPSNLHLSRHLSLSATKRDSDKERDKDRNWDSFSDSPIGNLQKTFTNLSLRGKPALDAARYKAEGAFSKRGFVQRAPRGPGWMREDGEARLIDDADDADGSTGLSVDVDDADSSLDQDVAREREPVEDRARRWQRSGVDVSLVDRDDGARKMVLDRDDLKWPAGEGWKPL